MAAKALIYYPYGNTPITNDDLKPYQEGFDNHGYTQIDVPNSPGNVIVNQAQPLQKIAADYSASMNTMNQNYNNIAGNIANYNTMKDILDQNAKYDFNASLPVLSENNTMADGLKQDTQTMALGQNNFYIAGTILSATLLITGIYLGM
jgi:hypothetical protein